MLLIAAQLLNCWRFSSSVVTTTLYICKLLEVDARCPAATIVSIISLGTGSGLYAPHRAMLVDQFDC